MRRDHNHVKSALQLLAQQTQTSPEEVKQIYEDELATLEAGARVHTFIPALALRRAHARIQGKWRSRIQKPRIGANVTAEKKV